MLFEFGEEYGYCEGLGLEGRVVHLPNQNSQGEPLTMPHMGWNRLIPGEATPSSISKLLSTKYFVHSYVAREVDPNTVMFNCMHGGQNFTAAVRQQSVTGFQFHPERSGPSGLALLAYTCLEQLK